VGAVLRELLRPESAPRARARARRSTIAAIPSQEAVARADTTNQAELRTLQDYAKLLQSVTPGTAAG
jgi:hypothetical protein